MRTNIQIDDDLMKKAMKAAGTTTKKQTVEEGLRLLIRRKQLDRILDLEGQTPWTGDLNAMRRDK
jgi:Arc/MetJ family transcription regulator